MKRQWSSILNLDMSDSQIPGQYMQRDLLHICASLYTYKREQTRKVHKQHTSMWQVVIQLQSPEDCAFSPGLLWIRSRPQHSSTTSTAHATHRFLCLAKVQPPGLVGTRDRQDRQNRFWKRGKVAGTKRKGPKLPCGTAALLHCNWASAHTISARFCYDSRIRK